VRATGNIGAGLARLARIVGRVLNRFAAAGTAGYPPETRTRLKILNLIAGLIAVTTGIYAIQQWSVDYATHRPIILINVALFVVAALVPLLHRLGPIAAALTLVVCEYAAMVALSAYLGRNTGLHMQLFVPAAASFVVLGLERLRLILLITIAGLVLHLFVWFSFPPETALLKVDPRFVDSIYVQAAITTCGLIAASVWYAFRLVEQARGETDALLRSILPPTIVDRLKSRPTEPIADSYDDVSVLFADISGFVALSRQLGAPRVVALLNRLVSEFDQLSKIHHVEKIKTIGDAYMAACGVPQRSDDHLQRLARMALDMLEVVERLRTETRVAVHIRIGMAAGPVLAAVIGRHKFTYDVWGDAVNLAARLESHSTPGRILVCPTCRSRLDGEFRFESFGTIDIRGLGACEIWFIAGPKSTDSGADTCSDGATGEPIQLRVTHPN